MNIRLGDPDQSAPPKTTKAGLLYYPYGLDAFGKNRVRKATVRMTEAGVEPALIAEFREWVLRLPTELPDWIDAAFQDRLAGWRKCIGARLPNGKLVSEGILNRLAVSPPRIVFHPGPFAVVERGGVMVAGAAWKDHVEVLMAYVSDNNTWLRRCDHLLAWECGNWIAQNHDYHPQDINAEIGNKNPC